jgi:phage regulator Rha-like protein
MNEIVKFENVEDKILVLRSQQVILDSDVAVLYGVETMRVNEAVKNNPEKFPQGYVFELTKNEKKEVIENFDNLRKLKFSPVLPKAFTEKGLYMLATILKSLQATETTIAIVETFAKLRELSRTIGAITEMEDEHKQKALLQKSGEIIASLLGDDLKTSKTETSIELNFALLKVKHTIKRT